MKSLITNRVLFFISLILYSFLALGQDIPAIDEEEVSAFSITRNQTFDGSSLWGYMNGGADIYLEYGFEILRVQELTHEDEKLKMELYKMPSPLAAFGIYSIKSFKCRESGMLVPVDCLNPYQYQLVHGDYYISITNESGLEDAKPMMLEIAQKIIAQLQSKQLLLPCTWLNDSLGLSPQDIKMITGPLGLLNKAPELSELSDGMDEYQVFLARAEKDGKKYKLYEFVFEHDGEMEAFMQKKISKEFRLIMASGKKLVLQKQ